jgi:hypothetical protein
MKNCKTCKHWTKNHNGIWDSENYGNCKSLTNEGGIVGLCEGCVNVNARVIDFEIVTYIDFYCKNYIKR